MNAPGLYQFWHRERHGRPFRERRPRKTVDETKLRHLAMIGCSFEQMARYLGVSSDTLERRYRKVIEESRGDGGVQILAKTFQAALAGNIRALELSLVNRCGWALRPEMVINVNQNTVGLSAEEIPAEVLARHRALLLEMARQDEQRTSLPPPVSRVEQTIAPASEETAS